MLKCADPVTRVRKPASLGPVGLSGPESDFPTNPDNLRDPADASESSRDDISNNRREEENICSMSLCLVQNLQPESLSLERTRWCKQIQPRDVNFPLTLQTTAQVRAACVDDAGWQRRQCAKEHLSLSRSP